MVLTRTILLAACAVTTAAYAMPVAATPADIMPLDVNSTDLAMATRHLQSNTNTLFQMCGIDIVGRDTKTAKSPLPDGCRFFLPNHEDAVTWTNHEGGTCWLKTRPSASLPPVTPKADAVSFFNLKTGHKFLYLGNHLGYDMPGYDIGSTSGPSFDACVEACYANHKCFAVTRTPYNKGTCWLKGRASVLVRNVEAQSMAIARRVDGLVTCPRL